VRLLLIDHLANAYESLRANRMRTFLTTLGVTIGIASITAILSLGTGVGSIMRDQVAALEGNIAVVRPLSRTATDITQQQSFATSTLTENDYIALKNLENVKTVAPLMIINGATTAQDNKPAGTSIVASTPALQDIAGLTVRDGQFLDDVTNQHTAVIGQQLSIDLFGTEHSIGQQFKIKGQSFTVIGVLKRQNSPINFNTVDFDHTAIIHLSAGFQLVNSDTAPLQQIDLRAESKAALGEVMKKADARLLALHGGERDFTIITGEEIAKPTSHLFSLVQTITIVVATISLVVGGIGIMNIMLVTVAERTREIGLRKAIGASNAHIIWQFLIESLIISIIGGISGYLFGYLSAFAVSTFLTFDPAFTWTIVGVAAGTSIFVGLFFGLYPAIKAAGKDPIESLRHFS